MATPTTATLDRLATDAATGKLEVPVSRSYTLDEVPTAFGDFAGGTVGKLAIIIG